MSSNPAKLVLTGAIASILAACGGGSGGGMSAATPPVTTTQNGNVSLLLSDASNEDWATIGVKVLSISLVPQSGTNVTVYTAPATPPYVNLVELDQLGELIGNASVPAGTYTGAVVTVSANPGDVLLNAAAEPEAGFAGTPGAAIPSADIQIQHAQGAAPNLTVPVTVDFVSPLVVGANQNNQLDLEFDLGQPAFVIGHVPPGAGTTIWSVDFNAPLRHHPIKDITRLVLRHLYGDVTAIASDNTSITIMKEYPMRPPTNPETPVVTTQALQILADATNGTLLYDVDAKTVTKITDFSQSASLNGKQVRIAARYQENGTLTATRIYASTDFSKVWLSPEGHVLHVDAANDVVTIENEAGKGVPLVVNDGTQFLFQGTQIAAGTPGTAFLANQDLVRGFKVHATVVDPLASPLVAQSIDIETAQYSGMISAPSASGFTYTHDFRTAGDDYAVTLGYISPLTANGRDPVTGATIDGYKWWYFAFPTLQDNGPNAVNDFVAATNGAVSFGGMVGAVPTLGVSYNVWGDSANSSGWSAAASIILPSKVPLAAVATGLNNKAFTVTVSGGATAANVEVSTDSGGATLVYQVDRSNGVVTVSPIDITTPSGLATLTGALTAGTPVKIYGVPQASGALKAYVLSYFTGTTMPAM